MQAMLGGAPERHPLDCACCATQQATAESLEELEFLRSACTAAQLGQTERLKRILERRPDCVHSDGTGAPNGGGTGYTPLHYAARAGHVAGVRLLLDAGSDVNRATTAGHATPLHRAAYMGHAEVVRLLLKGGANAKAQDTDGDTPLHKAAAQKHGSTLSILEQFCPAALELRNRHGKAARECCP
mmetsp:Transcript_28131/g.72942  ORF Transcript_28131/g.72942 Transcript_28131/m.72942 type:complete len:185 (-) Transcript_28131:169-723(-)